MSRQLADALRVLGVDAVEKAKSGHPGAVMGMADMAEAVWRGFLKHNPADPKWADRDRFILSNGHASMLLYGLLHLTGYDLSMDEVKNFRQLGSKTAGHPECVLTPGVEVSTGPLGQGLGMAVGMALAERLLAAQFNRQDFALVDHRTWVFVGDGCLMEGISQEAASLAGTLGLGKLIALYDDNGISIDGPVKTWFADDTPARFEACHWQVIRDVDGHDGQALRLAIEQALAETARPSLICCRTTIGCGAPNKAGSHSVHGSPLGPAEALAFRQNINWNLPPFTIPEEIYQAWNAMNKGAEAQSAWQSMFERYSALDPEAGAEFARRMDGDFPADWSKLRLDLLQAMLENKENLATRVAGNKVLELLVPRLPELFGGSADLSPSNGTRTAASIPVRPNSLCGNYLSYGVREFGMSAIMNGLARHGGFIPYGGTFLVFSDYAKNAIRLASIMRERVIWVLTHDSIGVGEDGPTHQPIEQLAGLRLTPGVEVWRPADNFETGVAWVEALERRDGPSCLCLSRQNLIRMEHELGDADKIRRGAYILRDHPAAEAIIIATGSELELAVQASDQLLAQGIFTRIVSMPCAERFDKQDRAYRELVLPPRLRARVAVEAAQPDFWRKYVGLDGLILGMNGFGESAPSGQLYEHFKITPREAGALVRKAMGGGIKVPAMRDLDLKGKRVVIRADLNVPIRDGKVTSAKRLQAILPTIRLALAKGAAVLLLSHLGRPKAGVCDPAFSLRPVADALAVLLSQEVIFVADIFAPLELKPGQVAMGENVRFLAGEKDNDSGLSQKLAALGEVYIMDAFGAAHRSHASTDGAVRLAKQAAAGPLMLAELDAASSLTHGADRPLVAIVGGSKVSTKLGILYNLLDKVDGLIVGGGIANTFLAAQGHDLGQSLVETDLLPEAKKILELAKSRGVSMPLPVDVWVAPDLDQGGQAQLKAVTALAPEDKVFDLGPGTLDSFRKLLEGAATVIWNGPIGVFERPPFDQGSRALTDILINSRAYVIGCGGDTAAALEVFGKAGQIAYLSTGGGAFIEFLEGKTLPAVAALESRL